MPRLPGAAAPCVHRPSSAPCRPSWHGMGGCGKSTPCRHCTVLYCTVLYNSAYCNCTVRLYSYCTAVMCVYCTRTALVLHYCVLYLYVYCMCTVLYVCSMCALCVLYCACMAALTPRAALCAAQTVDYAAYSYSDWRVQYQWPARRDGLTVHSSGGGVRAVYSGGDGCVYSSGGVCNGAPPAGTALRTGDTLTWAAGRDNQHAIAYEQYEPWHLRARTSGMAGWELCFA